MSSSKLRPRFGCGYDNARISRLELLHRSRSIGGLAYNGSRPFPRASINRRLVAIGKFRSCVDIPYTRARAGRPVVRHSMHIQPRLDFYVLGMSTRQNETRRFISKGQSFFSLHFGWINDFDEMVFEGKKCFVIEKSSSSFLSNRQSVRRVTFRTSDHRESRNTGTNPIRREVALRHARFELT